MTTYTPRVTINGTDVTNQIIAGTHVTHGRQNIDSSASTSYARLTILDPNQWPDITKGQQPYTINQTLTIDIQHPENLTYYTIFTGTISDIHTQISSYGNNGYTLTHQVTATGLMAQLARGLTSNNGYPSQTEPARITALIQDGIARTWAQMGTDIWTTNPTLTWQDLAGKVGTITAGTYTVDALTGTPSNALQTATGLAQTLGGILYDTPNERSISYTDVNEPARQVATGNIYKLSAANAEGTSLSYSSTAARLTNDIMVTYTGGQVSKQDAASVTAYGYWHEDVTLPISSSAAADAYANQTLRNAWPTYHIESLTFNYHVLSAADRLWLLNVIRPGKVIELNWTNTRYSQTTGQQFIVQGWDWTLDYLQAQIVLYLSDYAGATGSAAWANMQTVTTWLTLDPMQTWQQIGVFI